MVLDKISVIRGDGINAIIKLQMFQCNRNVKYRAPQIVCEDFFKWEIKDKTYPELIFNTAQIHNFFKKILHTVEQQILHNNN